MFLSHFPCLAYFRSPNKLNSFMFPSLFTQRQQNLNEQNCNAVTRLQLLTADDCICAIAYYSIYVTKPNSTCQCSVAVQWVLSRCELFSMSVKWNICRLKKSCSQGPTAGLSSDTG